VSMMDRVCLIFSSATKTTKLNLILVGNTLVCIVIIVIYYLQFATIHTVFVKKKEEYRGQEKNEQD
jgi:hypothetical protein